MNDERNEEETAPIGNDLVELLRVGRHPIKGTCPHCNKDCMCVALTELVYTFEPCSCKVAPYVHLVETLYHAECYLRRAEG